MNDGKICPLCGSDNIEQKETTETICYPFGGCEVVALAFDRCAQCYTEGDFAKSNDALIQEKIDSLKLQAVRNILNDFAEHNFNFAGLERSLGLPQRTLTKWKNAANPPSAAGVTLLKFLRLFPWLVEVAELKFDFDAAQRVHIENGMKRLLSDVSFNSSLGDDVYSGVEFHININHFSQSSVIDSVEMPQFTLT